MRTKIFMLFFLVSLLITSCHQYRPIDPDEPIVEQDSTTEFDFSTVATVKITIDYKQEALIPFQIYAEYPLILTGSSSFKVRTDIFPIAAGFTNEYGKYTGTADIPQYVDSVFIFSSAFFAPTLLTAQVVNNTISVNAPTYGVVESIATKAPGSSTNSLSNKPAISDWKLWLGSIGENNGHPRYLLSGDSILNISRAEVTALYRALTGSIMVDAVCPEHLRTTADMNLVDSTEISITMLGGNTCWNNSLGYYYYEAGNVPRSMEDVDVIALFPNSQDGRWTVGTPVNPGINRGDAVQLMYYPNIKTNSTEGATKIFPKGLKIGFVLVTNGWNSNGRNVAYQNDACPLGTKYYASSTTGLSSRSNFISNRAAHTAIFRYGNNNIICFEDFNEDENFSDVSFVVRSRKVEAIDDVPPIDPVVPEVSATATGIYAFEDNWPYKGDYDMNDVLATYNRTYYYNTNNAVTREFVTIVPFTNYAKYTNGLSYVNAVPANAATVTDSVQGVGTIVYTPTTFSRATDNTLNGTIYRITNDVAADTWKTFKLSFFYETPRTSLPTGRVFLHRGDKEIHIPYEAPTSEINYTYFGTGDDKTVLTDGNYYSSTGNFPFAIYLSNANERDLFKLLDRANEQIPIDSLYPLYTGWVLSNGQQNPRWYKE